MILPHRRRRYLTAAAAVSAGALLLAACGADEDQWPEGVDFELNDERFTLGDVIETSRAERGVDDDDTDGPDGDESDDEDATDSDDPDGQDEPPSTPSSYRKIRLGDDSELTDLSLLDDSVVDLDGGHYSQEAFSAGLETASQFVAEEAFDSILLMHDSDERRQEWFDRVKDRYFDESTQREGWDWMLESKMMPAYALASKSDSDEDAEAEGGPTVPSFLMHEDEGPRVADIDIEVTRVELYGDNVGTMAVEYDVRPDFIVYQAKASEMEDEEEHGSKWDGLGAGRWHRVNLQLEYRFVMAPREVLGEASTPEDWIIGDVRYKGYASDWDLDIMDDDE